MSLRFHCITHITSYCLKQRQEAVTSKSMGWVTDAGFKSRLLHLPAEWPQILLLSPVKKVFIVPPS